MTNPLLDKFYELHPEKKEVVQEQKPEVDPITSYPISENTNLPDKSGTLEIDLKEAYKRTYNINYKDHWDDWVKAYREVTTKKPAPIDPVLSPLTTNQSGVTVSQYNNTTTTAVSQDYQRHKRNYEFIEIAEKIKKNKANVINVICDIDNYSRQKRYVFEVICNDSVYPF